MAGSDVLFLLALAWLGMAALVGWGATQKGRGGASWFFLSLLFSPFFTVLALIACPAVSHEKQPAPAPSILRETTFVARPTAVEEPRGPKQIRDALARSRMGLPPLEES